MQIYALTAALDAPFIAPASRVQAVVSYSGDTDAFEVMGEYKLAGAAESDVNWPEYIGCANPVATSWDPSANACYTAYQDASPALGTDPFGGTFGTGPAILEVNSGDFTTTGNCETTPPRQGSELQLRAGWVGLSVTADSPSDCAHGFAYLSTQLAPTLAFLLNHL